MCPGSGTSGSENESEEGIINADILVLKEDEYRHEDTVRPREVKFLHRFLRRIPAVSGNLGRLPLHEAINFSLFSFPFFVIFYFFYLCMSHMFSFKLELELINL